MTLIQLIKNFMTPFYESIILDQDALDAQAVQSSFHKRSHGNQDPPNNREGENKKKRRKAVGEPSSRSSRRNRSLMVIVQDDTRAMQPLDQAAILIQKYSKPEWFPKNSGTSIVSIAKKFKELIQKDELTIADFEGVGLERLKVYYNNIVELEYHEEDRIDFFKAGMSVVTQGNVYSNLRIKSVVRIVVKKKWGYGFLTSIIVRRSDDKEYEFSYADLPRLSVNDVEDMYLIQIQDKLHHLPLEFVKDFNNALLMFIRRTVIKNRLSEVKKFSDGTLVKIQENLIDMLLKNKLVSNNKRLKVRDWTDYDVKSSREMPKKIDETLRHRDQLRRLEEYVRGIPKTVNPCTFVRPL
ncbi:hypothetical protein Tco_0703414 [Tanacetum coccineum]|uniref:Uncharacterized protein n=1 Tax=Tanacetum coccineum TaxID=301880 RepID=A0ABQ4XYR5_9ASTR